MSKNQNHGKMKEWRKPEYKKVEDKYGRVEFVLVKQNPYVRRKTKSQYNKSSGWIPPIVLALMNNVGIQVRV